MVKKGEDVRIKGVLKAARDLADGVRDIPFSAPVDCVYCPLDYAWEGHRRYVEFFAGGDRKRVIFLGMNPGPFGMMQTGVPFGEVAAVRDWMGIEAEVRRPDVEHPKRLIDGFQCKRSEVSGRRLWGLFQDRFGTAKHFFQDHFVVNYCPLGFLEKSGKNRTPEQLKKEELRELYRVCDAHLRRVVSILEPDWVIGVGLFAEGRAQDALETSEGESFQVKVGGVLHPSPANPKANRGWGGQAEAQLVSMGVWE